MMSPEEHYNFVARNPPQQCNNIRQAHNYAKQYVIQQALWYMRCPLHACCVTDLACGRGGDLNKLQHCKSYTGADIAADALTELQRRAVEINMHQVTVHHCSATNIPLPAVPQHLVLCNFALHYFCDSEQHAKELFATAERLLLPSGMLCGTYEEVGIDAFGVSYHAVVGDCVNAVEWRVPWRRVRRLALQHGFALVFCRAFSDIHENSLPNIYGFIMQKAQAQSTGIERSE